MPLMRIAIAAVTAAALTGAASAKPLTLSSETNLRAAPGTKSEIVTLMPKGSEIEVGECDAGWCKVTFGDKSGFAIGRNLGEAPPQTAATTPPPRSQADLQRLRRGYEQYFDDDNGVTGSVPAQRYSQNRRPRDEDYSYDDEDFDDVPRVYSRRTYVPPPVYYSYGPYPRTYYGPRPYYYYRRW